MRHQKCSEFVNNFREFDRLYLDSFDEGCPLSLFGRIIREATG